MLRDNQRISFNSTVPCALIGRAGTCYCWSDRRTNKVMILIPCRTACAFRQLARHGLPLYMGDIESSLGSVVIRATCSKASCKGLGNVRPLFFARRSIPAQALGLKKYRCGRSPVSKMSDNVDSAATLGDSEKLSVKHSPRARIPDVVQRPEECPEVPSAVCRKNSGHVFPDNPLWTHDRKNLCKDQGQSAALSGQSRALSGDGEVLARCSADNKVNCSTVSAPVDSGYVTQVRNFRIMMFQDSAGERFDFGKGRGLPPQRTPGDGSGIDAAAKREITHKSPRKIGRATTPPGGAGGSERNVFVVDVDGRPIIARCVWYA